MGLFSEDWGTLAVVLAGALAGGFANGLTGFGTGLTALPFWLQVVEPVIAAQLASACGVIGQVATLPTIWHAIDWRRLAPTLLAGLVGVPIGIFLLPYVSLGTFKLTVGLVLIAYCSFMLLAAGRIKLTAGRQGAEMAVGFMGGILGGLAGLSGPLPTIWAALKGWQKQERRIFFQATARSCRRCWRAASCRASWARASCWPLPSLSPAPWSGLAWARCCIAASMTAGSTTSCCVSCSHPASVSSGPAGERLSYFRSLGGPQPTKHYRSGRRRCP